MELANDVNDHMPDYVVRRLMVALNRQGKPLSRSRVLLLGLAYKADTGDAREAPAMIVADRLLSLGAEVRAADPNVLEGRVDPRVVRVDATPEEVAAANAVVVLTDHHDFDFEMIRSRARYVLDTRGRLPARGQRRAALTMATRPDTRPPHLLGASIVSAGLAVITLIAVGGSGNELGAATVVSLAVYALLLGALFLTSPRSLCVANVFGVLWAIWFPLRLLVIQADRRGIALHPVVRSASDGELVVVWVLSLLGFAAFVLGVHVARRRGAASARFVPDLRRNAYLLIAVGGLVASWALVLMHVHSGVMGEAGNIFLLGIAGAAFVDARSALVVGRPGPRRRGSADRHGHVVQGDRDGAGDRLGLRQRSRRGQDVAAAHVGRGGDRARGLRHRAGRATHRWLQPRRRPHAALFDYDLKTGLPPSSRTRERR